MAGIYAINGKSLTAIADAIREKTGSTDTYTPGEMAEAIREIESGGGYDEGYEDGYRIGNEEGHEAGYRYGLEEGHDEGYAAGQQAEYDAFWDVCQENGYRTNYSFAFGGYGWRDSVYNPKYPIVATNTAYSTFYNTGITDTKVPIVIDTTGTVGSLFNWSNIQRIPSIKITEKVTNVDWFSGCSGLEVLNVTEDSVIAVSGMNLTYCTKLTHDSLMSVINALKDYSGTGTTRTVTLGATNLAKLTDAEKAIATQKGWTLA